METINKIPKNFLEIFKTKNIEFITDKFEEIILEDIAKFDENTRIKLHRNLTDVYSEWFYGKLKAKENILINIKGNTRSGKSLVGLKNLTLLHKFYNKPLNIEDSVCANQKEYRQKVIKADFGDSFLVDENSFANIGVGSMSEIQQLKDLQNITAKKNLHTIYITPRTFLDTGATIGLAYFGKDTKNWLSRFLLYSLKGNSPTLLGYVIFDVGSLFKDSDCYVYKFSGGCTNPNRLSHEDISKLHKGQVLKYSKCIDLNKKDMIILDNTKTCPYYEVCNSYMCAYEHKKDKWINRELKGGLDERKLDRYKTALELFKVLTTRDSETGRIRLNAKNGKEMKIKIDMKIPSISNTKYTRTELEEIQQLILSMTNEDFLIEICKNLNENIDDVMQTIK